MGDPPPIDSYAARDLGARRLLINSAINGCNGVSGPGKRIMSGSANKLYKKPFDLIFWDNNNNDLRKKTHDEIEKRQHEERKSDVARNERN